MSNIEVFNSSNAKIGTAKIEYGTVSGPASYLAGGFATDLSARFTAVNGAIITINTAGAGLTVDTFQTTVSSATFTIKVYVSATGIEVANGTNLSGSTFNYVAIGS